ncbi:class I SAM-dependent methyltransferase [Peribacillus sp. SI8-4]|uniref:class I SAM-dependent methyltransferase n=1 Tax=Peribacillus sp. SI8-4 TaxID=3048009 RepID=UPI002556851A|nr:class I SAM-dependent methyltransferase [Peribacillus sp. SI8-4]
MNLSYQDALAIIGAEGAHPGGFALTKQLLNQEKINRSTMILDAGCGTGQTSQYLVKTFQCQVSAIDIRPEMIEEAKKRFHHGKVEVSLHTNSIEATPFDNEHFDLIIAESTTAFTHIQKSLREFHRILKQGGILLTIDMTAEEKLEIQQKKELMAFYQLPDILTESEWSAAFEQQGFTNLQILKSNTVLKELMQTPPSTNRLLSLPAAVERVLKEHYRLILTYGDSLGYRVFRANKL